MCLMSLSLLALRFTTVLVGCRWNSNRDVALNKHGRGGYHAQNDKVR